jgi:hypothetical protein
MEWGRRRKFPQLSLKARATKNAVNDSLGSVLIDADKAKQTHGGRALFVLECAGKSRSMVVTLKSGGHWLKTVPSVCFVRHCNSLIARRSEIHALPHRVARAERFGRVEGRRTLPARRRDARRSAEYLSRNRHGHVISGGDDSRGQAKLDDEALQILGQAAGGNNQAVHSGHPWWRGFTVPTSIGPIARELHAVAGNWRCWHVAGVAPRSLSRLSRRRGPKDDVLGFDRVGGVQEHPQRLAFFLNAAVDVVLDGVAKFIFVPDYRSADFGRRMFAERSSDRFSI